MGCAGMVDAELPHRGRQPRPLSKGYLRPSPAHEGQDVIRRAKWFPERRFSEEIGINVDTSVTTRSPRFDFRTARSDVKGADVARSDRRVVRLDRKRFLDRPLHET